MQYLSVALPLAALASGVLANPVHGPACVNDACLAAVTGRGALGDAALRASHCSSFLATTVTPIVTATVTVTGDAHDNWKRATVALCPNEVPNYASACNEAAYTSACSCFGYTDVKTTTVAPTTTTKTIWVKPTGGSGSSCTVATSTLTSTVTGTTTVVSGSTCPAATATTVTSTKVVPTYSSCPAAATATTVTVVGGSTCPAGTTTTVTTAGPATATTVTVAGPATATTVTVTTGGPATATTVTVTASGPSDTPSSCVVTDALATTLVNNFMILLEYTSYNGTQGPPGRGYQQNVSDATLASDFSDVSDSINFMAGFPLGSVTFPTKEAFDIGQGTQQPEVAVTALNIWHDCNSITWRWRITSTAYPVNGMNYMIIDSDGKIQKNYAEFDNGAWLQSFGRQCAINPVSVNPTVALRARALGVGM
ncbi:uncharacterized protein Z520_02464 [Fonsecaea multimorphosa CBS 102226]|uniref:NTF2-like domain-containing protein n=1 Tax=Fonsecaea multimorphosa CBS 102226 TaxID=1442371 RepID=A0A0D2HKB5_9EURO|nr:uncharacterized protein Z520_02464 [Fonsecaea multimorphosa CBS 102226]KIY02326.1 hypothetical protein Z520_02464 [Fonsecaea multimorphosa CBS 102226]OAL28970.1 hypothetical protein AYO22_02406 [Fonsecaea multimorphosa]